MNGKRSGAHYHDGYANLAAAILDSGIRCNDTEFLESDWADTLRYMCTLDDEMYANGTGVQIPGMNDNGGRRVGFD